MDSMPTSPALHRKRTLRGRTHNIMRLIVLIGSGLLFCHHSSLVHQTQSSPSPRGARFSACHAFSSVSRRNKRSRSTPPKDGYQWSRMPHPPVRSSSFLAASATLPSPPSPPRWFPTKIQQDVDYTAVVQSMYLRHIVVERTETAQLVMEELFRKGNTSDYGDYGDSPEDPFARLAQQVSACSKTKEEGGVIGWVDTDLDLEVDRAIYTSLIPQDIVQTLVNNCQPKTGDIHIVSSNITRQVHIVKVEELLLRAITLPKFKSKQDLLHANNGKTVPRVGAHSGINAMVPRTKLKGQGVLPQVPSFSKINQHTNVDNDSTSTGAALAAATPQARSYTIQTNGCQMNVADSERLEGILQHQLGIPKADVDKNANVLIVNTCSIRDHAEQKLYDLLGPYRARKRQNEHLAIIVTGCVAQQEGIELLQKMPEIDVVLGPQYVPFLGNVLEQLEQGHQLVLTAPMLLPDNYNNNGSDNTSTKTTTTTSRNDDFSTKPIRGHTVRAWVNTIYGCNEHCSYCVVPATRGMEQSRSMESILLECMELIQHQGYKEVTLLGQNIDAFGRDMIPKRTFADLLHYLNANIPNKARIRYVTSHPRYFSDRVIEAVASLDKVCECFHMPFQAGDNTVLQQMRRGYTFESYMKIIDKIRAASPDAAITADVIVGFPGETEQAFQRTLDLMEAVKFDNLNSFAYSPRPNTEAALWTNGQVPEAVKKERLSRVQELANQHALQRSQRYLGRTVEVLVEDKNPRSPKQVMGRTRQGRQVYFDGDIDELLGEFVNVDILEARTWSLVGRRVREAQLSE